jgi:uncharacterized protein
LIHRPWLHRRADGEVLRGDLRLPDGPPPESAVVLVHGFKGFKDWGFFPWLAEALAADGHAVVSFNFSRNGIGTRPEDFTELEAFARNTLSREQQELQWVLGEVRRPGFLPLPPRRLGVLGHSRGGGQAILTAAASPPQSGGVDALVTWAAVGTFDRWSEETREQWRREGRIHVLNGRTGEQMPLNLSLLEDFEAHAQALDLEAAARRIQTPWLIVHGDADETVAVSDAYRLAKAGNPLLTRLHLVARAGHTFGAVHPFQGETPPLREALAQTRGHFRSCLVPGGL